MMASTMPHMAVDHRDPALVDPAIFWFWNDAISPEQIDRTLDAFLARDIRAVYVHPMPGPFRPNDFHGGMTIEYLSDDFFDLVVHTCRAMQQRGMILWLYDEGGWPSGMAGGKVVAENRDYGIWLLQRDGDRIFPRQLIGESIYPDLMNPAATDCFIRLTHERYRQSIGEQFGKTVRGIFTDEARLLGRVGTDRFPWSPLLPAAFRAQHGVSLDEVAPRLFEGAPDDDLTRLARRGYIRTMSALIAEHYYARIRQWCERNGLLFEGHHSGENEFARHGQYFGDYLQQARHYHIPGVDTIWRQVFPGKPGGNFVSLASSSSWLRGSRIAVSESFAIYGAGMTLEQMRWVSAYQLVRGVNKIGAMTTMHSMADGRRIGTCSDLSPKNPLWQDIDLWSQFTRNVARFTTRGLPCPRVGIYYRSELVPLAQGEAFDRDHDAICNRVHDALAGLVFVGADDLANAQPIAGGGLRIGAAEISMLILHLNAPLDATERALIERVYRRGVEIVEAENLDDAVLGALAPVKVDRPLRDVRLLAIEQDGWHGYLFFNEGSAPAEFTFEPKPASPTALREVPMDPSAPTWLHPIGASRSVHLMPGECRAFESVQETQAASPAYAPIESREIAGPWELARTTEYTIAGDVEVREIAAPMFEPATLGDYAVQHPDFSGSLLYHTALSLLRTEPGDCLVLDLGKVFYAAEVWLNGQSVGRRAWGPYWFDLTDHARSGTIELRIRTTNTLANQWLRPDVHARDMSQYRNMYLDIAAPFMAESLHAGLAGPVTLRVYRRSSR